MVKGDFSIPLPKYVVLELTRRCNNKCLHCYTVWGEQSNGYPNSNGKELTTDEVKQAITKVHEELPLEAIGISGGEPTLREDLPEILSFIAKRGLGAAIITNGTLLNEQLVNATIHKKTVYQVTLLSYRREIHDRLAGRKGAWEDAVNGMIAIKQAGGNLAPVFVATKLNYMDLDKTAKLALVLGAKSFMYNRMNLGAHNLDLASQLLPTPEMIIENLESLEELGAKYGLTTVVSVVIEPCVVPLREYKHVLLGWCPSCGENSYFTIDPEGNIRICNHSPVILGNIKQDSLKDIFNFHPYVQSFRTTLPDECENCSDKMKSICRGGCKASGEQCYGTLRRVDPFVTFNKPTQHN